LLTRGFLWQFTSVYLSVKWVINPLTSFLKSFFLSSSTSSSSSFVCEIFLNWIFQHWLLYDKLSSNNNNNYHHVSVIQVSVSELTTCRALVLYNAYVTAFTLVNVSVNSVLKIDQQQLALYTHFSQTMIILALLSDNVLFVQTCITLQQMRTHQLLYINAILIQSQDMLVSNSCTDCQKCSMMFFLKCHCMSEHFSECCDNCKWCDHAACYSVHNNDVLIIISDDENNDSVDENEHIAKLRWIASALLSMRAVIIDLDLQVCMTSFFFSCVVFSIGLVVWTVYDIWAVCLISVWCSKQVTLMKSRRNH